jgi:putative hydrolase of the HAD superfamily
VNAGRRPARARVRGVIWDLGGILHPTPFEVLPEIERDLGLPPGVVPRGPFDPDGDPDYAALDRGEIDEATYLARLEARVRERGFRLDLRGSIDWEGRDRPEVVAAMQRLSRRFRQAMLTNDASAWLGSGWWSGWYLRHCFVAILDAAEEGIRKPHPEIYRRAARALGLLPEECLFIDDLAVNVEGARAVGMEGFRFDVTDPRASVRRLLEMLGVEEG